MGGEIGFRSESKSIVGEKHRSAQFDGKLERCKRVKIHSDEMTETSHQFVSVDKEKSQETLKVKNNATSFSNIAQGELTTKTLPSVRDPGIISFDLNSENHDVSSSASIAQDASFDKSKGFCWDLNAEIKSNSNSPNEDPSFLFKSREHLKSSDASECGSTTGPLDDKDPMKVWKEMKQNGFLSSSHMNIAVAKQKGKISKSEGLKKKMELAKKDQVDRFAKIAAPSGLLNELNPGIINHVRNRKQVHSIIEALVRIEKNEKNQGIAKLAGSTKSSDKDDSVRGLGMTQLGVSHNGSSSFLSMSHQHTGGILHFGQDYLGRDGNSKMVERWFSDKTSFPIQKNQVIEDDALALKLASSTTMASEDISSLSNEDFVKLGSTSSLSVKGATAAFQWLELLQQDIKGRLTALRRSKKRVRSVITTELPFLISREFSSCQENDPHAVKNTADGYSLSENADAHCARWNALFDQMKEALSEEEKQLETWLHQVKEMQLHCGKGLQQFHPPAVHGSEQPGAFETDPRSEEADKVESELAVRAAAGSIYSTCNYLSTSENLPCF